MDYWNFPIKGVADVGAGLGAAPLIKVGDGIVVGVGDVVFCPITLEDAMGVFFVIALWGIFYCCNASK